MKYFICKNRIVKEKQINRLSAGSIFTLEIRFNLAVKNKLDHNQ